MSKESDLTKLKELLSLKRLLHRVDVDGISRYSKLVDWAKSVYWKINLIDVDKNIVSTDNEYDSCHTTPFVMVPGNYTFFARHVGKRLLYSCGCVIDPDSGTSTPLSVELAPLYLEFDNRIKTTVVRVVSFHDNILLEDVVSNIATHVAIEEARSIHIPVTKIVRVKIDKPVEFTYDYYKSVINYLKPTRDNVYIESICCIKDGEDQRMSIDFSVTAYYCIASIGMTEINDNKYVPYAVTFSGHRIIMRDVDHALSARIRVGSFVAARKLRNVLVLSDTSSRLGTESRSVSLRRLVMSLGGDVFANGKYLSKISRLGISQLDSSTGCVVKCSTAQELCDIAYKNPVFKNRIISATLLDITCELLEYDRKSIVTLINHIHFKIDNRKIIAFDLDSEDCLKDNPTLETLYENFCQFVAVFNLVSEARDILKGA